MIASVKKQYREEKTSAEKVLEAVASVKAKSQAGQSEPSASCPMAAGKSTSSKRSKPEVAVLPQEATLNMPDFYVRCCAFMLCFHLLQIMPF